MTDESISNEAYINLTRHTWWYAVQVHRGREFEMADVLAQLYAVYDAYCPSYMEIKKPSRHTKRKSDPVQRPLFEKWLFVRFHGLWRPWEKVLRADRHIEGFLSIGGDPLPIRDYEITKLRRECEAGVYNDGGLKGKLEKGDKIAIRFNGKDQSPFIGYEGEFQHLKNSGNSVIEISIFGRPTLVEIPTAMIEKLL